MYLHIGNNKTIKEDRIVGIFDADSATVSHITRKYLAEMEKQGGTEASGEELPKSFVLYRDRKGQFKICFAQLSTAALSGRANDKK